MSGTIKKPWRNLQNQGDGGHQSLGLGLFGFIVASSILTSGGILAVPPAIWLADHIMRTMRSYDHDTTEQKIKILREMDKPHNSHHGESFVKEVLAQHRGKSNVLMSTKTSKEFDEDKSQLLFGNNVAKAKNLGVNSLQTLIGYMGDRRYISKYHNSGRRLFKTVMTTRSIDWMKDHLNKMDKETLGKLVNAILKNYHPGFMSSDVSKGLHKDLLDGKVDAKTAIGNFLSDTYTQEHKNDKKFFMLETIEKEMGRLLEDEVQNNRPNGP